MQVHTTGDALEVDVYVSAVRAKAVECPGPHQAHRCHIKRSRTPCYSANVVLLADLVGATGGVGMRGIQDVRSASGRSSALAWPPGNHAQPMHNDRVHSHVMRAALACHIPSA